MQATGQDTNKFAFTSDKWRQEKKRTNKCMTKLTYVTELSRPSFETGARAVLATVVMSKFVVPRITGHCAPRSEVPGVTPDPV